MIELDESDLPLVVVRVDNACSRQQLRDVISALERVYDRDEDPYAVLIDLRSAELPTKAQLDLVAASVRSRQAAALGRQASRPKLVGLAFVTANPAMIAAIYALLDMAPLSVPTTIEERLSRARAWARTRMSEWSV